MTVWAPVGDTDVPARPDDALLARVVTDDTAPAALLDEDFRVVCANEPFPRRGWDPDGLPCAPPNHGSINSSTSGRSGVVAAWSR